jgi:hypothetical protein
MYVNEKMSIPDIHKKTGIALSTIRYALKKAKVLRKRSDGIRLASQDGKLGKTKGRTRVFSEKWKENISRGRLKWADQNAAGVSLKPSGYVVYTRGPNKDRHVHVVLMENHLNRPLFKNEVVHHIDKNKQNNTLENLMLMTTSEHARHHALENYQQRERKENGQFK